MVLGDYQAELTNDNGRADWQTCDHCPGGGVTPLCDLYGEVPLNRIWFLASFWLNFRRVCPKQGLS